MTAATFQHQALPAHVDISCYWLQVLELLLDRAKSNKLAVKL